MKGDDKMSVLTGIHNLLQFVNDNWGMICTIVLALLGIIKKVSALLSKSDEEKISVAKKQISETMLKLVTKAEKDYLQWVSAGSVKRAEVIDEIFEKYPILSKVTNQEELIEWLDDTIDEALKEMRKIFEAQNNVEKSVVEE